MTIRHLKRTLFRIPKISLLNRPKSMLAVTTRTTEFSSSDLRHVLRQISPRKADQALLDVGRGIRPLLGTLVSLLSESNGRGESDLIFVTCAHEKLIGRRPDDQELQNLGHALAAGFLSRAEVVQNLISSPEFERRLKCGRLNIESADVGLSEALLIDRVQRIFHPSRLLPPARMRWTVGQQRSDVYGRYFEVVGRHFQTKLVRDAGLGRASRVLDIGSGCGRIAMPLTEIIGTSGLYMGLETDEEMVKWCRRNINARFPHFRFIHCAVQNSAYNPKGTESAEQYKFPFDADHFDLAIATSVFTHLRPASAQNYMVQCARVLRPGGRLFATAFLIENGSRSADWNLKFDHKLDEVAFTSDPSVPEAAVAYPTGWLLDNLRRAKLELVLPIHKGSWSGKQPAYSGQDVLILQKNN